MTLRSDVAPGEVNTLPLSPTGTPSGSAGVILFLVYAPSHGNPWRVPVSHVTLTRNGVATPLPACPAKAIMIPANASQLATVGATLPTAGNPTAVPSTTASTAHKPATPSASGLIEPFAGHKEAGPGHTPDVNQAYLFAAVLPTNSGDGVVIRGKAPTTPRRASPSPWPASGTDLRYWSLCIDQLAAHQPVVVNHLPNGRVDLGCRYDSQVALDKNGDYTIVIGTESHVRAERSSGSPARRSCHFHSTIQPTRMCSACAICSPAPRSLRRPRMSRQTRARRQRRPSWARTTPESPFARLRRLLTAVRTHALAALRNGRDGQTDRRRDRCTALAYDEAVPRRQRSLTSSSTRHCSPVSSVSPSAPALMRGATRSSSPPAWSVRCRRASLTAARSPMRPDRKVLLATQWSVHTVRGQEHRHALLGVSS